MKLHISRVRFGLYLAPLETIIPTVGCVCLCVCVYMCASMCAANINTM
jgi:hypothetical protein